MSNEMNRFVSGNKKTTRKSTGPPGGMMMCKFYQRESCWWLGAVSGITGPGAVGSMSLQEGPLIRSRLKFAHITQSIEEKKTEQYKTTAKVRQPRNSKAKHSAYTKKKQNPNVTLTRPRP